LGRVLFYFGVERIGHKTLEHDNKQPSDKFVVLSDPMTFVIIVSAVRIFAKGKYFYD
jgi:hypothetical protein